MKEQIGSYRKFLHPQLRNLSFPQSCLGISCKSTHEFRSKPSADYLHHTNSRIKLIDLISGNVAYKQYTKSIVLDQAFQLTLQKFEVLLVPMISKQAKLDHMMPTSVFLIQHSSVSLAEKLTCPNFSWFVSVQPGLLRKYFLVLQSCSRRQVHMMHAVQLSAQNKMHYGPHMPTLLADKEIGIHHLPTRIFSQVVVSCPVRVTSEA